MKIRTILFTIAVTFTLALMVPQAVAEAAGSSRVDSIKSHGVYYATNPINEEVYLDAGDLISLAEQIDDLQELYEIKLVDEYNRGYTEGYAKKTAGKSIAYVYHVHTDGTGKVVTETKVYASSNPGGCYVAAGHAHNKTGTCPTKSERCTGTMVNMGKYQDSDGNWHTESKCNTCGHQKAGDEGGGRCTQSKTVYTCGDPTNTWKIGCGKTTSTIIRATITYYDN